jgi:hypothetical protein
MSYLAAAVVTVLLSMMGSTDAGQATTEAAPTSSAATAAPTAPSLTMASVASVSSTLSWRPPTGWQTFPEKRVASATALTTIDGRGGDVRITLPSTPVGPITIQNCRNAVLIGGSIRVLPSSTVNGADQRGIYVKGCTGTVHIEGVLIDGNVAGAESDGIAVSAPSAVVQVQNVRIMGLRGSASGNHADVFQPWGGVREYRIDRLTATTNYQGINVKPATNPIGSGTIRRSNIASSGVTPIDNGGYFFWMNCNEHPITLEDVYVSPRTGRAFGQSVWPGTTHATCPATVSGGVASWPLSPSTAGVIRQGAPVGGDFVPAGTAGAGYVSPGYS